VEYIGYIIGASGVLFSGITLGYNLSRNRRIDTRADGDREFTVREALSRLDERVKRAESDVAHCVRADLLAPHLAALEARVDARIEAAVEKVRGERRREQ